MESQNANAMTKAKPGRRRKQGNSDEFSSLLSRANTLSVSERIRLTKSLAGQLGFICIKPGSQGSGVSKGSRKKPSSEGLNNVRPNPLKGTALEIRLNAAKATLRKAKEDSGQAKLDDKNPAVVEYNTALQAYKAEKKLLAPVQAVAQPSRPKRDRTPEAAGVSKRQQLPGQVPMDTGTGSASSDPKGSGSGGSGKGMMGKTIDSLNPFKKNSGKDDTSI